VAVIGAAITAIIAAGVLWKVPARTDPDAEGDAGADGSSPEALAVTH
jgi:hypothetical protein